MKSEMSSVCDIFNKLEIQDGTRTVLQ